MKTYVRYSLLFCLLILTASCVQVVSVRAISIFELSEGVTINVDCRYATVEVESNVMSDNDTLVHFPSGVNMSDSNLDNVTMITVTFSTTEASLNFLFESGIDNVTAKAFADAMLPTISTAFDTDFVFNMSTTVLGSSVVIYMASGKANLSLYTEGITSECLIADLQGFSSTFVPISSRPNARITLTATKMFGSTWLYMFMSVYETDISAGSGAYTIDILDLLNVSSLGLSPYEQQFLGSYLSKVTVNIESNENIDFMSCEPSGLVTDPTERGWSFDPMNTTATAYFSYGNDSSPVSPLTLTIGTVIVPEFTTLSLIAVFATTSLFLLFIRRRLQKTSC